jgi:hypothetical protein
MFICDTTHQLLVCMTCANVHVHPEQASSSCLLVYNYCITQFGKVELLAVVPALAAAPLQEALLQLTSMMAQGYVLSMQCCISQRMTLVLQLLYIENMEM